LSLSYDIIKRVEAAKFRHLLKQSRAGWSTIFRQTDHLPTSSSKTVRWWAFPCSAARTKCTIYIQIKLLTSRSVSGFYSLFYRHIVFLWPWREGRRSSRTFKKANVDVDDDHTDGDNKNTKYFNNVYCFMFCWPCISI